jgi:hypothetical protein
MLSPTALHFKNILLCLSRQVYRQSLIEQLLYDMHWLVDQEGLVLLQARQPNLKGTEGVAWVSGLCADQCSVRMQHTVAFALLQHPQELASSKFMLPVALIQMQNVFEKVMRKTYEEIAE